MLVSQCLAIVNHVNVTGDAVNSSAMCHNTKTKKARLVNVYIDTVHGDLTYVVSQESRGSYNYYHKHVLSDMRRNIRSHVGLWYFYLERLAIDHHTRDYKR